MTSTDDQTVIRNMIFANNEGINQAGFSKDGRLFDENWNKHWTPDAIIIRPSGNPMDREVYKNIVINASVSKLHLSKVLSVDSIRFIADGKAAVATITTHEKFNYMGTENDDIVKVSLR